MKLQEILDKYLPIYETGVKPGTLAIRKCQIANHILPFFGNRDLDSDEITLDECEQFVDKLKTSLSDTASYEIYNFFAQVMRFAKRKLGIPWANHVVERRRTRSKGAKSDVQFFTEKEAGALIKEMKDNPSPKTLAIIISLTTGMRIGEVCALRFKDIDWDYKLANVRGTLERLYMIGKEEKESYLASGDIIEVFCKSGKQGSTTLALMTPKTAKSERACPLIPAVYKVLKGMRVMVNDDYFIASMGEQPCEPRVLRTHYDKLLERRGLPKLNFHALRHTCATRMLNKGVDIATVAAVLGHASPATTLEIYVHSNNEEKKKALNKVFGAIKF